MERKLSFEDGKSDGEIPGDVTLPIEKSPW